MTPDRGLPRPQAAPSTTGWKPVPDCACDLGRIDAYLELAETHGSRWSGDRAGRPDGRKEAVSNSSGISAQVGQQCRPPSLYPHKMPSARRLPILEFLGRDVACSPWSRGDSRWGLSGLPVPAHRPSFLRVHRSGVGSRFDQRRAGERRWSDGPHPGTREATGGLFSCDVPRMDLRSAQAPWPRHPSCAGTSSSAVPLLRWSWGRRSIFRPIC
jgi:hypothetical protein